MTTSAARLWTREYTLVVLGTYVFWVAFGTTLPILPVFVVDELGHGEAAVGLVFGLYAVAAVAARPLVGRVGDRRGRRRLIVSGAIIASVALFGHLLVSSLAALVLVRVVAGAGQAAVVVGLSTLALDHSPSARHGEASSFVMVAVQLGMGTGPLLGALLLARGSYDLVWAVVGTGVLLCLVVAALLPKEAAFEPVASAGLFHRAALRPGVVMGLGILGFVGYLAFVPLYAPEIGVTQVAPLFLLASGTMALVRALGARVPDRIGAIPSASAALTLLVVAFVAMGTLQTPVGLAASTLLMAVGAALLAPSLVLAAVQGVAVGERARVMATITMFLDIASALGPTTLGVVAASRGFGTTFVVAGVSAGIGLVLLRRWVAPRLAPRPEAAANPDLAPDRAVP